MRIPARVGFCVALLLMAAVHQSRGSDPSPRDEKLLPILRAVYARSGFRYNQYETAAFVSVAADGQYRCTMWPFQPLWHGQQFRGTVPEGTIAIVHTHPKGFDRPSGQDVAESKRTGYTFYVISFWCIYRIDPSTGRIVAVIRNDIWTRERTPNPGLCADSSSARR